MAGESYAWIDANGVLHPWDGSGNYTVEEGEQDTYMPPVANVDQRTPQRPGSNVLYVDVQTNILTLPLRVSATTEMGLRTAIRQLTQMLMLGKGTLRATAPDGSSQRDLICRYYGGVGGDGSYPNRSPGSILMPLQLQTDGDPYWRDPADTTTTSFSNTTLASPVTVTNNGDVDCWPVWTITGPFANLTITNQTTGEALKLTANGGISFTSLDTLTLDMYAGTLLRQDGASQISHVTWDSVVWRLVPGNNSIAFSYTGGVNGQTTAQASYRQRYWSC